MMLIESERLFVRHLTMDDLDDFHALIGDDEIMRYIRAAKTYEESRAFLQQVIDWYSVKPVNMRLGVVEKESNALIGSFAIIPIEHSTDIQLGYSFRKSHWGRGYATEITRAGAKYAFEVLGLQNIAGVTEATNTASSKVLLKCGFLLEKEYEEAGKPLQLYRLYR